MDPERVLSSLISQNNLSDLAIRWSLQKAKTPSPGINPIIAAESDIVVNPDFCTGQSLCQSPPTQPANPAVGGNPPPASVAERQRALAIQASATLFPTGSRPFTASAVTVTFAPLPGAPRPRDGRDYLLYPDRYPLYCVDRTTNTPGLKQEKNFTKTVEKYVRVRSTAAQLTVPQAIAGTPTPTDAFGVSDNQYLSASGAKLSFGQTSGSSATTDSIVGTIGLAFPLTDPTKAGDTFLGLWAANLVPYFGIDREGKIQTVKGKTAESFTVNTLDYGFLITGYVPLPDASPIPDLAVSFRPDYLRNYLDGSAIFSFNSTFAPIAKRFGLNAKTRKPAPFELTYMMQLDIRADLGWFTDYGTPTDPRLNKDFVRLGFVAGPIFEFFLPYLPDFPIDTGVTYTDFLAPRGFHKDLGNLQAMGSFNFDKNKILALTIAYANGRRDDTAQRVEMWSVGITLHF
jgi:hypothetical protein